MSTQDQSKTRVTVIGAGPGGYAAAFHAADLGLDVTLIDKEANPGGVCLYRGCIPSKALLHVANVISEAREAAHWGVTYKDPTIDVDRLRAAKEEVVDQLTGGLGQLSKSRKIRYVRGTATFEGSTVINVDLEDKSTERIETDYTILATGSRPAMIPGLPDNPDRILDSTGALEMKRIPKSLLVVGGGYIGLELGQVYAALGTKVTVVEMMDGLLPGADRDLVKPLAARCNKLFEAIYLKTKVVEMKDGKNGVRVTFEGADVKKPQQTFDQVLVSIGRRPNTGGLGLESTKVQVNERGFVTVDQQRRTADPAIFAIGDIAGEPQLAHKATAEGHVAASAITGKKTAFEPNAIPAVVFTDPEVAWCGMTEAEAKEAGRSVTVAKFPWAASGRATTLHRHDGLTKLIADKETHQVLGVAIVGPGAGEMISEGVLAVEMGALAEDLALSIHPHPTLSETVMESAELIFGPSTHLYRK
jgi:dihydrolipoamide dehydrogenase